MCPLPSPSPNTASSFSALLGALAQPLVVLDSSDASDNNHLPLRFFQPLRSASPPPFGARPRVTPLSELSELSELDNHSPPRSWLAAAAPSSCALAFLEVRGASAPRLLRGHAASGPIPLIAQIPLIKIVAPGQ